MTYNIILVTLDGLRNDRIFSSEYMKKFSKESWFFSNMITAAPYTLASLHAIFSGMYPSKNGVNGYYRMFKFKKDHVITLTEVLQKNGFYTSCDIIDEIIVPEKGFSERNIFDEKTVDFKKRHSDLIKKMSKKEKFFLFLHYTEPHRNLVEELNKITTHDEYIKSKKKLSTHLDDPFFDQRKENENRYDSYMPDLENYIKTILDTISECGIQDKTILIFHADHGTSLGEKRGEKFYGVFTYDYTVKVFSFIKVPGKKSQKIDYQCRTIDLFSTILELCQIDPKQIPSTVQGESLLPFISQNESSDRKAFVETGGLYGPWPSPNKHNVFCFRHQGKKIIYNDTPNNWEFYDLKNDPHEVNNLFDEGDKETQLYKNELIKFLKLNEISTQIS